MPGVAAIVATSIRAMEFVDFAMRVVKHIDEYTVPQYGDKGNDLATEYSYTKCIEEIKKYAARAGNNARGEEESLRDLLKIAHYAQLALAAKLNSKLATSSKQ